MESIVIQIPSILENIRVIESFIDNAKEQYNINDDIRHGNREDRKKNVNLTLSLLEDTIKFVVKDEGEGFDHQHLPDPTAPENLEKIGGRGIFLMRQLADELHFREQGREVEMVFYVSSING